MRNKLEKQLPTKQQIKFHCDEITGLRNNITRIDMASVGEWTRSQCLDKSSDLLAKEMEERDKLIEEMGECLFKTIELITMYRGDIDRGAYDSIIANPTIGLQSYQLYKSNTNK